MQALAGKVVLVTGSGSGIGAAYARLAASEGAYVIVNDVADAAAQQVVDEIVAQGGRAVACVADISSWEAARGLIDFAVSVGGRLDGLVNNAALFHMSRPEEESEAALRKIVEVNVMGTMFCGIHAISHMQAQGGGAIVNITSGAQAGITRQAAYGATKGAVAALTYSWAVDLAEQNIRVNAVSPMARSGMSAIVHDYFSSRGETPWPELQARPEDNAPLVVYLLSERAAGIHGQVVRMDGKRLSLMTHPAVLHPAIERETWTVDSVADLFDHHLAAHQLPLGVVALEARVRPYGIDYGLKPSDA